MQIHKFEVYGGPVFSINDGERHSISARRVAEAYGVNPKQCNFNEDGHQKTYNLDPIELHPDPTGEYDLAGTVYAQIQKRERNIKESTIKRIKNLSFFEKIKFLF
jgi:hypothetical protein